MYCCTHFHMLRLFTHCCILSLYVATHMYVCLLSFGPLYLFIHILLSLSTHFSPIYFILEPVFYSTSHSYSLWIPLCSAVLANFEIDSLASCNVSSISLFCTWFKRILHFYLTLHCFSRTICPIGACTQHVRWKI